MRIRAITVIFAIWGTAAIGVVALFLAAPRQNGPTGPAAVDRTDRTGEAAFGSHVPVLSPVAAPPETGGGTASEANGAPGDRRTTAARPQPPPKPQSRPQRSFLAERPTATSLAIIEDLLDRKPAAEEGARVQLVQRLAKLKAEPRAFDRLLAVASSGLTRGERIAAIDVLASPLSVGAKPTLEKIAKSDPDAEVQQRAAMALAGKQG